MEERKESISDDRLVELEDKLFNIKPNEHFVKTLKGEMVIPIEDLKKMVIPKKYKE